MHEREREREKETERDRVRQTYRLVKEKEKIKSGEEIKEKRENVMRLCIYLFRKFSLMDMMAPPPSNTYLIRIPRLSTSTEM